MPLVEHILHQRLIAQAGRHLVDDLLRVQRRDYVVARYKRVLADHAQEARRRQPSQLMPAFFQKGPQADDVGHWPVGDQFAKAALFMGHIQNELRIARHAFELAQVSDDPRILHQALQVLGAHQHDFFRVELEEHFFKCRPLGVHQAVLEAGAEDAQRHGREVAIIADLAQLRRGLGNGQMGFQFSRRTEAVQTVFVQPLVIAHALS
jgi:hypothetical protein